MKLTVLLGLLLGLVVAFPALAVPVASVAHWLALQPLVWAFVAGLAARPRITRLRVRRAP